MDVRFGLISLPRVFLLSSFLSLAAWFGPAAGISMAQVAPLAAESPKLEAWGPVHAGLQARVFPVSAETSEDALAEATPLASFASAEDVAFVIELKNVSDKPVSLLDTRYGDAYGDSKGKSNSNWYGQFLCTIDLFNQAGQKVERPEVQVVDLNMTLDGMLIVRLEPGQTHKILLRPAKWLSAMTQRMEPGSYRAAIRYHGVPAPVLTRIKEYRPETPLTAVIAGDVVTPQVAFEIVAPKPVPANAPQKTVAWGKPSNGLRAGVELMPRQESYSHGEKPEVKLHIQNVGDKPVTVTSQLWMSDLAAKVTNEQGVEIPIQKTWYSGWTSTSRVTLRPQQIVIYDAGNIGLAATPARANAFEHVTHRKLVAPTGSYFIELSGRFGNAIQLKDGKGKILAPLDGDWIGELTTGVAPFTITPEVFKPLECDIVDGVTGKPVAGTTSSFRFIKPKTDTDPATVVALMVWGPQAASHNQFTIPDHVMQREDRDELILEWGVGNHPDYENHAPAEPIAVKQLISDNPKSIRDQLRSIKLKPKRP